jgi:DNA-binding HxlR family transcriptional regulator
VTATIDPTTLPGRPCSAAAALELVGDRWSLLIVREVLFGNHRFSALVRNTGAPRDRLAARLKVLAEDGILERRQYCDAPPRWEYHLTRPGRALGPVLQAQRDWGDEWAVTDSPVRMRHHEHEFTAATMCTTCGERVRREDVHPHTVAGDWDVAGPV